MLFQACKAPDVSHRRRWSLVTAGGLLAFAVLLAGVGLRPGNAQPPDKKPDVKKDDPRADPRQIDPADAQIMNELLFDFARDIRFLLNDIYRDNAENPYGPYRPRVPPHMIPERVGVLTTWLPTPLGVSVDKVAVAMADQLDLKKDVGLLVCKVTDGTAAAKAGLRPHDVLVEVNGKEVPADVGQFLKLLDDIKTDTPFDAVVLRKGKRETLKGLMVPGAKARSDARPVVDPVCAAELADLGAERQVLPRDIVAAFTAPEAPARIRAVPGKGPVQATSSRAGDRFTARYQDGGYLLINVTGQVADGRSAVGEILVKDPDGTTRYAAVDDVPEKYRAKVRSLVELDQASNLHVTLGKK